MAKGEVSPCREVAAPVGRQVLIISRPWIVIRRIFFHQINPHRQPQSSQRTQGPYYNSLLPVIFTLSCILGLPGEASALMVG